MLIMWQWVQITQFNNLYDSTKFAILQYKNTNSKKEAQKSKLGICLNYFQPTFDALLFIAANFAFKKFFYCFIFLIYHKVLHHIISIMCTHV